MDEIVIKTALEAGGFSALAAAYSDDPERQHTARRLFLRVPMGGMGLYSCSANARAAFLGSAALTCETVRELGIDVTKAGDAAVAQLPYVREHKAVLEWVQQRIPNCDEVKNWTLNSIFGSSRPRLQHYISTELAKADLAEILQSFPDTEEGRRRSAEFQECGQPKAGAWVQARASDTHCVLNNGEFWIGFALRLGLAHRLYPEVSPHAVCKACKQPVGPSIPSHCFGGCSKPARRGRNLRHTALKNVIATVERLAVPGTNIIMEPFVAAATGAVPTASKYAKSRADVFARPPGSLGYIVDATIVDATLGPAPATNTSYEAGKATEQAFTDKVTQYTSTRFSGLDPRRFRAAAFELRGAPSKTTLAYLKEIKHREISHNKSTPKSVVACRLYQRVSVAIIRAIAYNVMEYRCWRVPVAVPVAAPVPVAVPAAGAAV